MLEKIFKTLIPILSVLLCLFTLTEVNFPRLQPQSQLSVFVMLGLILCFLNFPEGEKWKNSLTCQLADLVLSFAAIGACGYVVLMSEPIFDQWFPDLWPYGKSLGDRAGLEGHTDFLVGTVGLLLILEATRRSIGWIVPMLAILFCGHSFYSYLAHEKVLPNFPEWLLPHAGQDIEYLVSVTFSQSLGVFGPAASVMFKYVFLFVLFGAFLELSGATRFIITFAEKLFGNSPGGPAKVAVLGSGLMGSLSGSAVANAVTTGAFTIPMMRNAGFQKHIAGGITAAAAAGGALVPPVMGAGAYMMLELVQPQVTFLTIAKAAVIPAILFYLSIFLIVHFYAKQVQTTGAFHQKIPEAISKFQGVVFFVALGVLILFLLIGFTPFKAVSGALVVIVLLTIVSPKIDVTDGARWLALVSFATVCLLHHFQFAKFPIIPTARLYFESYLDSSLVGIMGLLLFALLHPQLRMLVLGVFVRASRNGMALIAASACVGIIIGIVQSSGIAADFSSIIKGVVDSNLLLALVGIMICSIILGMGVPSVVCYLLMATLMGSLLHELGVQPLAAHLFIFYFGMMSMVTPPVALAAYASASLAGGKIMKTALASFRFSLVGFSLPFMFVYRPELLLLSRRDTSSRAVDLATTNQSLDLTVWGNLWDLSLAVSSAILGICALAAGISGFLRRPLSIPSRLALLIAAVLFLWPELYVDGRNIAFYLNLVAAGVLVWVALMNWVSCSNGGEGRTNSGVAS